MSDNRDSVYKAIITILTNFNFYTPQEQEYYTKYIIKNIEICPDIDELIDKLAKSSNMNFLDFLEYIDKNNNNFLDNEQKIIDKIKDKRHSQLMGVGLFKSIKKPSKQKKSVKKPSKQKKSVKKPSKQKKSVKKPSKQKKSVKK
jgi:hypothetical protein